MFKIKKKIEKPKPPILYNVIEDYSEFDAPGNVTACAMTLPENIPAHAKILSESYDVPLDQMTQLLSEGGVYVYPQVGGLLTRGLFACRIDPTGASPKQTWVLDLMQFAEAEQWARARGVSLADAAGEIFYRTLPEELKTKLAQKNLGLDYRTLDRAVAKGGDIKFIDFRKDWSPHFKRLCIMPDGRLVETGGLEEFAQLHQITVPQAKERAWPRTWPACPRCPSLLRTARWTPGPCGPPCVSSRAARGSRSRSRARHCGWRSGSSPCIRRTPCRASRGSRCRSRACWWLPSRC